MAQRYFFYRGQPVLYTDINTALDGLEAADHAFALDAIFTGISIGGGVAQAVAPNLSVVLAGPTVAYDQLGQRIYVAANTTIDCSKDYLGVSTAVVGVGNKKILSVFLLFARSLSNPQTTTDTPPATIQYNQAESFQILVYQGPEGAAPSAPALLSNGILLCDITLSNTGGVSQTQIHTDGVAAGGSLGFYPINTAGHDVAQRGVGDVTNKASARTQLLFAIAHGATWAGINATSILGALTAISTQIDTIGTAGGLAGYLGSNLTPNVTGSWADASNLAPEVTMGDAVSDIVRHLGSNAAGSNGARLLGIDARTNWLDGTTNVATSVYAAINKIITDLAIHNSTVNNGANKIGFLGSGTLLSTDVSDALDEVDVNWGKLARGASGAPQIWTGEQQVIRTVTNVRHVGAIAANLQLLATDGLVTVEQPAAGSFNIALPATATDGAQIQISFRGTLTAGRSIYITNPAELAGAPPTDYYGIWLGAQSANGGYTFYYDAGLSKWKILHSSGTVSAVGGGTLVT